MAFDLKKEYKEFYMPETKPGIVNVTEANYIAEVKAIPMRKAVHVSRQSACYTLSHTP